MLRIRIAMSLGLVALAAIPSHAAEHSASGIVFHHTSVSDDEGEADAGEQADEPSVSGVTFHHEGEGSDADDDSLRPASTSNSPAAASEAELERPDSDDEQVLLEEDEEVRSSRWCCLRSRGGYNLMNAVGIAGALSAAGAFCSGLPTVAAQTVSHHTCYIAGASVGAIGNLMSTILQWRNKFHYHGENRAFHALPAIDQQSLRNDRLLERAASLADELGLPQVDASCLDDMAEVKATSNEEAQRAAASCWPWTNINVRNTVRVTVPGLMTFASAILPFVVVSFGADENSSLYLVAYIVGSLGAGGANTFSTWWAYEKPNQALLRARVKVDCGRLAKLSGDNRKEIKQLIGALNAFSKKRGLKARADSHLGPTRAFVIEAPGGQDASRETQAEKSGRYWRNGRAFAVAFGLSGLGALVASYVNPDYIENASEIAGIVGGSFFGAAGTSASTYYPCEGENDAWIERTITDDTVTLLKRCNLSAKAIRHLQARIEKAELAE